VDELAALLLLGAETDASELEAGLDHHLAKPWSGPSFDAESSQKRSPFL
jgi:hypothetical protein